MKWAYLKYIAALLLFGLNGIVASRIALSSYEIVLLRTMIGSLLLVVIFILMRGRLSFFRCGRETAALAVSGMAMGASWMFLYEAYQQIGVSLASLAYYCGPVIVMVLSPILFRERMTKWKLAGFFSVLCGIFFVNGQVMQESSTEWGLFCGAMAAVMYAFMVICNKKAAGITGMENAMLQLLISFLTVAVFVGFRQGFMISMQDVDWGAVLMLGLLNTGIGCYLYFSSIGCLPVQTVAVCGYLEPLSAVVFSALLLGERMSAVQMVGAVLIIGGAAIGECSNLKLTKQR